MVWEKRKYIYHQPLQVKIVDPDFEKGMGYYSLSSLLITLLLTLFYVQKFKQQSYTAADISDHPKYPVGIIYSASLLPVIFFTVFIAKQVYELLLLKNR